MGECLVNSEEQCVEDSPKRSPSALVLGGQTVLGRALSNELLRRGFEVHKMDSCPDGHCLTVFSPEELTEKFDTLKPQYVFNTISWTNIDSAEANPDAAAAVNSSLPALIGRLLRDRPSKFVQFSTAYIFDGRKHTPYTERDTPNPVSIYGKTKLAGERALSELNLPGCLIVRGSWLFEQGKEGTVGRMLADAKSTKQLSMAHDFIGSPTFVPDMAFATVELAQRGASGIFNVANAGQASLCEFASEVVRLANLSVTVSAYSGTEHAPGNPRPSYSVLDCSKYSSFTGLTPRPWLQALRELIYTEFLGAD